MDKGGRSKSAQRIRGYFGSVEVDLRTGFRVLAGLTCRVLCPQRICAEN